MTLQSVGITTTGPGGCASATQEPIATNYLELEELSSPDIALLEGHSTLGNPGFPPSDDTWSFTGSY